VSLPPPQSTVLLCPKIVSDSGYGQTAVSGEWFRMPSPLIAIMLDYVHLAQLRQPDRHKRHSVADEADLLPLHCGLEADTDCSCLFGESHWLNLTNSIACEPA